MLTLVMGSHPRGQPISLQQVNVIFAIRQQVGHQRVLRTPPRNLRPALRVVRVVITGLRLQGSPIAMVALFHHLTI